MVGRSEDDIAEKRDDVSINVFHPRAGRKSVIGRVPGNRTELQARTEVTEIGMTQLLIITHSAHYRYLQEA
jgi:hypothetical protein